ncbi:hypothetical protein [Cytobacillus kochii]|uniref:hypothetical protein n=1 Tax=Cytobacillus kochii TaxID=859143 RepID=UPI00248075EF|nr:hypothetical protein [Cytobacillus kochii]
MIESNIMVAVKSYVAMLLILFMLSMAVFLYQIQQVNGYKQYVNYQIERHGGLTSVALNKIDEYSSRHYNNKFSVTSAQQNQQLAFGSVIDYEIQGTFNLLFLDIAEQKYNYKGSAVSLIR